MVAEGLAPPGSRLLLDNNIQKFDDEQSWLLHDRRAAAAKLSAIQFYLINQFLLQSRGIAQRLKSTSRRILPHVQRNTNFARRDSSVTKKRYHPYTPRAIWRRFSDTSIWLTARY
jgi:hypothetical protein